NTSTWRGFWAMFLDTKADRIVHPPAAAAEWAHRAVTVAGMFGDDLWWPLLGLGLVGVFAVVALARRTPTNGVDETDRTAPGATPRRLDSPIPRQSAHESRLSARTSRL